MNIMRLSTWMFSLDDSILLLSPHKVRILQLLLSEKIHLDEAVVTTSTQITKVMRKLHAIYSPPDVVVWRAWPPLRAGIKSSGCFCTVVGVQMDGVGRKEGRETQKQELMLICLMIRVIIWLTYIYKFNF